MPALIDDPADDDDDFDPALDRRRARRRRTRGRRSVLRVLVLFLICIGLAIAIVVVARRNNLVPLITGADAATHGQNWSPPELGGYLKRKGLIQSSTPVVRRADAESCTFSTTDGKGKIGEGEDIFVVRMANDQAAAEEARKAKLPAFSWGRFYFTGQDKALVERIRKALCNY